MRSKVLFIMHMPPPVHGAAVVGKLIHDSDKINDRFECWFINESSSSEISHIGKFRPYKILFLLRHFIDIYKTIKKFNPDVVYITPAADFSWTGVMRFAPELITINWLGKRKIIHFHNKGSRDKSASFFHRWYYHLMFKNSKVIFLSKQLKSQFDWILEDDQALICPNGKPEEIDMNLLVKENIEVRGVNILFLSNLMETKGVFTLLDALEKLRNNGMIFRCDFIGAESMEISSSRFNREINKRGLANIVTYQGKKYGEEKRKFFLNADIFVHPTYDDCFPLVLLEAMEYSLPIITTNVGGIPDIVENNINGLIVEVADADMLAESIKSLIIDKELRVKLGKEGRNIFKSKFTSSAFEDNLIRCIEKAL